MIMKIVSINGDIFEKPMNGKNYSIWSYPVTVSASGQTYNVTLKSFTKTAIAISIGQDVEVDKQTREWNGKMMTDYIIKNEKKPFAPGGAKYQPREKLNVTDFEKLVNYCWSLSCKLGASNPADAFDKILGVASMNLDITSVPSAADAFANAVHETFVNTKQDENIPF